MNLSNDSRNSAYDGAGRLNHTIWRSRAFNRLPMELRLTYIYLIAGPAFSPSGIFAVDPSSVGAAVYPAGSAADATRTGTRLMDELVSWHGVGVRLVHYDEPTCWIPGVREFYLQSDIPGIKDVIDRDVAKVLPGPVLDAYKAEYELGDSFSRQHTDMTLALYDVMNLDATLDHPAIESFAYDLAKTYTHEEITLWYGSDGWWYKNDWRGKRGNYPNIASIRDTVKKASDGHTTETTHSLDSFRPLIAAVERLTSRGASATDAKLMITSEFGEDAWKKLTNQQRWTHWRQAKEGRVQWLVLEAMKNE